MIDRLVSGIRNNAIKKRILDENDLNYEKAVQIATTMETADQDAVTFRDHHSGASSRLNNLSRGGNPKREGRRLFHQDQADLVLLLR